MHHIDFGLPFDVTAASLGNLGVEEVEGLEAMVRIPIFPSDDTY